jgi:hypothetical protein
MISNYLSSGTKSKQNADEKIDIKLARVVLRERTSFVDIFNDAGMEGLGDLDVTTPWFIRPTYVSAEAVAWCHL